MKFFIDTNLGQPLANGMRAFGEDVDHLKDHLPEDTPDREWLKYIGEKEYILITRDDNIRRNPVELKSLKDYNVGAFFLGGKNRTRCQLIQQLVKNWPRIKEFAVKERKPFIFRIPPTGTKFVRIPVD